MCALSPPKAVPSPLLPTGMVYPDPDPIQTSFNPTVGVDSASILSWVAAELMCYRSQSIRDLPKPIQAGSHLQPFHSGSHKQNHSHHLDVQRSSVVPHRGLHGHSFSFKPHHASPEGHPLEPTFSIVTRVWRLLSRTCFSFVSCWVGDNGSGL